MMSSNSEARKRAEERNATEAGLTTPFGLYRAIQQMSYDAKVKYNESGNAYDWGFYEALDQVSRIVNLYYRGETGRS